MDPKFEATARTLREGVAKLPECSKPWDEMTRTERAAYFDLLMDVLDVFTAEPVEG